MQQVPSVEETYREGGREGGREGEREKGREGRRKGGEENGIGIVDLTIDTIDYVTRIGNYETNASHDHYGSEAGGQLCLGVRMQVVSCLHMSWLKPLA